MPILLKRFQRSILFTLLCALLAGCASSERMARMSGGVFQDYQAPSSMRIQSEKYRKIQANSDAHYGLGVPKPGQRNTEKEFELNENLVNLWPFFFRSGQYTSVFWPFIDADPYGFAFRPFYNHEGDDYSILFPLSAWNTQGHDGWCLLGAWWQDGWAVVPLAWSKQNEKDGYTIVLPLYWHDWLYGTQTFAEPRITIEKSKLALLLAYYGKRLAKDTSEYEWLWRNSVINTNLTAELTYRLANSKDYAVPTNQEELNKLRKAVFDSLPDYCRTKYGLFPFVHLTRNTRGEWSVNLIGPLFSIEQKKHDYELDLLWWLIAKYRNYDIADYPWSYAHGYSRFFSLLLLSYFGRDTYYKETAEIGSLKRISSLLYGNYDAYQKNLPAILAEWKKIDPNLVIPKTVVDATTMRLFMEDFAKGRSYATYDTHHGCILPLYWYDFNQDSNWWTIPLLITSWKQREHNNYRRFFSLPLFTYIKRSKRDDITNIAAPLIWYSHTHRNDREYASVTDRSTFIPPGQGALVETTDDWSLLWLYHHGHHAYLVNKEAVTAQAINTACTKLINALNSQLVLESFEKTLQEREKRFNKWVPQNEIQKHEKAIEEEHLKIERLKLQSKQKDLELKRQEAQDSLAAIGFKLPETLTQESVKALHLQIKNTLTEPRYYDDYGSIFFHRESYENGDGNWNILFGLASGRKQEDSEQTQVLHFLYRYTRQGDKSERIVFPFIAQQKNGSDSTSSFCWRLWQKQVKNGKTGGYFCFIPWGEH